MRSTLPVKFTNASPNAPLVLGSVSGSLTREETLRATGKVRAGNIGEEDPLRSGEQNMSVSVCVLNMRGQPLMPTTPQKARRLLRKNKAQVVQRTPFMIQLRYATGENRQEVELGLDPGYSQSGFSVITDKEELMAGEVHFRTDISTKLTARRRYRKARRHRKTRYRPPRWKNRRKPEGWLPLSMQHKVDSHCRLIRRLQQMLPITKITIEVSTFDTQKMKNPEICGVEYQQGTLHGYEVREYLLEKWGRQCAYCKKKNLPLQVEHMVPRSRGGSNRVSNLTLSCPQCNQEKGNKTAEEFGFPRLQARAKKSLKAAPFMNLIRSRIIETIGAESTFGYQTKYHRTQLNLPKSHVNDAFVIAGGRTQTRSRPYHIRQVRRNNRQLQKRRKGYKRAIRRQRYPLQPYDLVRFEDQLFKVKGVTSYGRYVRVFDSSRKTNRRDIRTDRVTLVKYGKGFHFSFQ